MQVTLCADLKLPSKSHSLWAVVSLWCTSVIIDVLKASVPHVPASRNIQITGFICLCGVVLCDIIITLCICHLLLTWLICINWFITFSAVHEKGTFVLLFSIYLIRNHKVSLLPLVLVPLLDSRWQWCPIFELRWATLVSLVWTILHDHRRPCCEIHSVHVAPFDLSLSTSAALFHSERINCECTDSFLKLMIKKKLRALPITTLPSIYEILQP